MKDRIFWQLIRRARERRNVTQTVLAERIGMQRTNLSAIESGRGNVTEDVMVKIAQALGTDLRALLLEELVCDALAKPASLVSKEIVGAPRLPVRRPGRDAARKAWRAAGLCGACGAPTTPGKARCAAHDGNRGINKCGQCGQTGHILRACPGPCSAEDDRP